MLTEICATAPDNWQVLRIQDVCLKVTSGGTPSRTRKDFYEGGTVPWVKTQELRDSWIYRTDESISEEAVSKSSAKLLPENTVLMAMYGATVGQLGILRKSMSCNQACCAMIADPSKADFRFLYYMLLSSRQQLKSLASGAAQQNLSGIFIKSLAFPFPPLIEQKRIAGILGALDDKIELNRKMNETLEQMAKALFKSWFIDFDPVHAKADGRQPFGMDKATADLFPDSFVDSELGKIPKGWMVKKVGEFINRLSVGQKYDQKTVLRAGNIPVFDQGKSGVIGFHNNEPGVIASADKPVIVFANHTCYMRLIAHPFSAIQNVLPFVGSGVDTFWTYYATVGRLSFSEYKGHWPDFIIQESVVPPHEITEAFARCAKSLVAKIWVNEEEQKKLTHIRENLLPKLLKGGLTHAQNAIAD